MGIYFQYLKIHIDGFSLFILPQSRLKSHQRQPRQITESQPPRTSTSDTKSLHPCQDSLPQKMTNRNAACQHSCWVSSLWWTEKGQSGLYFMQTLDPCPFHRMKWPYSWLLLWNFLTRVKLTTMWSVPSYILFIFMGPFSYKVTSIKRFMTRLLAADQTKRYIIKNVCSSWLQTK